MNIATRTGDDLARYLDLANSEIKLTAANMANIDTPGYRAVGMDFEGEMRRAISAADGGLADRSEASAPHLFVVDGLVVRPDGNDVSMDRESLKLAEAQLRFKTGVALLKHQYSGIMDAIHADSK